MVHKNKIYIDEDGVNRGYYVYLHKDHATGEVFYVGKGYGNRAWDTSSRNEKWLEKVGLLGNAWDVEIVKQDLSEIEAFELEAELVEKYGGPQTMGGKLTNLAPGGENNLSFRIEVPFDDGGWSGAYYDARKFKQFSRKKEETFVRDIDKNLDAIDPEIECLQEEAEVKNNKKLSDNLVELDCFVGSIRDVISDFLRHRVSWKDLAIAIEEIVDDIEYDLKDEHKHCKTARSLLERVFRIASSFLSAIDSGNREEAEDTASRITGRK